MYLVQVMPVGITVLCVVYVQYLKINVYIRMCSSTNSEIHVPLLYAYVRTYARTHVRIHVLVSALRINTYVCGWC